MRTLKLFLVLLIPLWCRCDLFVRGGRPNSRPIKTIKTSHGDIFDCVDIQKQPAFDNPLLKDHQILMKPNVLFENFTAQEDGPKANGYDLNVELEGGGCPDGTVPIHRLPKKNSTTSNDDMARFWAIRRANPRVFYGASSRINVYGVDSVGPKQGSAAMIWLFKEDGDQSHRPIINAGWAVDPQLYGDGKTRLTIGWSKDGSTPTCVNLHCPGFVQTNKNIALGGFLTPLSTYKGPQAYVYLHVYADDKNNWWFAYRDVHNTVGYWPASLFDGDGTFGHATTVDFGGLVQCRRGEVCPAMGSGATSIQESPCTMERVQVVGPDHHWGGLGREKQHGVATKLEAYDVGPYWSDVHAYKFEFGGPPCSDTSDVAAPHY